MEPRFYWHHLIVRVECIILKLRQYANLSSITVQIFYDYESLGTFLSIIIYKLLSHDMFCKIKLNLWSPKPLLIKFKMKTFKIIILNFKLILRNFFILWSMRSTFVWVICTHVYTHIGSQTLMLIIVIVIVFIAVLRNHNHSNMKR